MKNSTKIKKAKEIAREIKTGMKEPEMRTIRWSL
jgi:hypothetical protein